MLAMMMMMMQNHQMIQLLAHFVGACRDEEGLMSQPLQGIIQAVAKPRWEHPAR